MIISQTFKSLALARAVVLTPAAAFITISAPAMAQQNLDLSQVNVATIQARRAVYNDEANAAFQKAVADGTGITFDELDDIMDKDLSEAEKKIVQTARKMKNLILKFNLDDSRNFIGVAAGLSAGAGDVLDLSHSVQDFQNNLQQILDNSDISDDAIALVLQFTTTNNENDGNAQIALNNLVNKYPVKTEAGNSGGGNGDEQNEQQDDALPPLGEISIDLTNVNVDTMFQRQITATFAGAAAINNPDTAPNPDSYALTSDEDKVALVGQHLIAAMNTSGSNDFEGSAKGILDQVNVPDDVAVKILEYMLSGAVELETTDKEAKKAALTKLLASYNKPGNTNNGGGGGNEQENEDDPEDSTVPPPGNTAGGTLPVSPPPSSGGGGGGSDYGG